MSKYHPSDDGKIIDGKIVVFLKAPAPFSASERPRPSEKQDAGSNEEEAQSGESGAVTDPPGTPGGIPDGRFAIETELTAAGGTPLVAEPVRIVDPDTDQQVGQPGVTDEHGVFRARVPEEKEYHLFALHEGAGKEVDAWSGVEHPAPSNPAAANGRPRLVVVVVDEKGLPVAGETVHVSAESGEEKWDVETDGRGRLEMEVEPGLFTLEARGKSFVAHSVFNGDLRDETAPCKFVLA